MWTFDTNNAIGSVPPIDVFNPTELNTDAWLEASVAFQAKYAVLTAVRFLWWDPIDEFPFRNMTPVFACGPLVCHIIVKK